MCTHGFKRVMYLAGQLGHMSCQSDVWAVNQGAPTAGLFTGFFTVANLTDERPNEVQ